MKVLIKEGLTPGKAPSKPSKPSSAPSNPPKPIAGKGAGTPPVKK